MRAAIAYLTSDEVNFHLAIRFARECRASLVHAPIGRREVPGSCAARLNDLDHVHPDQKDAILKELLARPAVAPVAVHGYGLDDGQVAGLRVNCVLVSPSLMPTLVRGLCLSIQSEEGPIPLAGDADGTDPSALCRRVRCLASEVHKALSRTRAVSREGLNDLRQECDLLRAVIDRHRREHGLPLEELGRWLDRLAQKVEDQASPGFARIIGPRPLRPDQG